MSHKICPKSTFHMQEVIQCISLTTPAPTIYNQIKCDETLSGDYNNMPIDFEFVLTKPSQVIFDSCSSDFNTQVQLYDAAKQYQLDISDDSCEVPLAQSQMITYLDTGTYYYRLSSIDLAVFGTFNIEIFCIETPIARRLTDECIEWMWIDNTKCKSSNYPKSTTKWPTIYPITLSPTNSPILAPTSNPIRATINPTITPTKMPTNNPTNNPSAMPTQNPIRTLTKEPTSNPTPTSTNTPTDSPTIAPINRPTISPTDRPTTDPTQIPSKLPTDAPLTPTLLKVPTGQPTSAPTNTPTVEPTEMPLSPSSSPTNTPTGSPIVTPSPVLQWRLRDLDAKWVNINGTSAPIDSCNSWQHGDNIRSYKYVCSDDDGVVQNWYMDVDDCSGVHSISEIKTDITEYNCDDNVMVGNTLKIKKYNLPGCHVRIQNESYYVNRELIVDYCITDSNNKSYLYQCSSNGGYIINMYDDKDCIELSSQKFMAEHMCVGDKIEKVLECNSPHIVETNFSVDIIVSTGGLVHINNPIVCWANLVGQEFYGGYYDVNWNDIPGDVCDHNDLDTGEIRDACYFEVKYGEAKWKRNCIHHTDCPNNGNMGCVGSGRDMKCCCNENYCNSYTTFAAQGLNDTSSTNSPDDTSTTTIRRLLSDFDDGVCTDFWKNETENDLSNNYCAVLSVKDEQFIPVECDKTYSFLCNKPRNNTGICRSTRYPTFAPTILTTNEPTPFPTTEIYCPIPDRILEIDSSDLTNSIMDIAGGCALPKQQTEGWLYINPGAGIECNKINWYFEWFGDDDDDNYLTLGCLKKIEFELRGIMEQVFIRIYTKPTGDPNVDISWYRSSMLIPAYKLGTLNANFPTFTRFTAMLLDDYEDIVPFRNNDFSMSKAPGLIDLNNEEILGIAFSTNSAVLNPGDNNFILGNFTVEYDEQCEGACPIKKKFNLRQKCDDMDIIFVVDIGCPIEPYQCQTRQHAITEMILSLQNITNNIRIGYIVYTQRFGLTTIHLNDYDPNTKLDTLINEINTQLCRVKGTISIYSGIQEAIDEFILNGNTSYPSQKRIVLLPGCENEYKNPCDFTNNGQTELTIDGNPIEFTIINTVGNTKSTIINPDYHLSCLSMSEKRLFLVEKYDTQSWQRVINHFKYAMCGIDKGDTNSPTIEPSISPIYKPSESPSIGPTNTPITLSPTTSCELSPEERPCNCFDDYICMNRVDCIWDDVINECVKKPTPSPTHRIPTLRPTRKIKTDRPTRRIK